VSPREQPPSGGSLPENWTAVPFPSSLATTRAKVGKVNRRDYMQAGPIAVVDQGQDIVAGYWSVQDDAYAGSLPVIVFGDHTRVFKFVNFPFVAGADGVKVLVPDRSSFDARFFYCACLNLDIPSRGYNRHYALLKEVHLPCPPLPEQRAIARVLRTVQEAIEATERVIEAAKELKRSMMEYLFTYGPVPVDQADQVELSEINGDELPMTWKRMHLKDVADVLVSTTALKRLENLDKADCEGVRVMYLKVSDLANTPDETVVSKAALEFEIPEPEVANLKLVPSGAVVFPKRGAAISTNRKRRTGELAAMDPNLAAVAPKAVDSEYLLHWFERFDLRSLTNVDMLPQLNKKDLEPLPVPIPSQEEQLQIRDRIRDMDNFVEAERSRLYGLSSLFDSLLHNLMTGKIRVTPTEQDMEADE